jgi:hypothetical protein
VTGLVNCTVKALLSRANPRGEEASAAQRPFYTREEHIQILVPPTAQSISPTTTGSPSSPLLVCDTEEGAESGVDLSPPFYFLLLDFDMRKRESLEAGRTRRSTAGAMPRRCPYHLPRRRFSVVSEPRVEQRKLVDSVFGDGNGYPLLPWLMVPFQDPVLPELAARSLGPCRLLQQFKEVGQYSGLHANNHWEEPRSRRHLSQFGTSRKLPHCLKNLRFLSLIQRCR